MRMIALRPKDCCRAQEEDDPLAMTASEPSYASSSVTRPSITSIASRRYHRSRSRFAPWNTSMLAEAWRRMPLRQSRAWALPARHATCAKLRRGYSPSAKYSALILRRRCRIASMPPGYSSGLCSISREPRAEHVGAGWCIEGVSLSRAARGMNDCGGT